MIAKKSCRDNWFTKDKHLPCGRQYDKEGKAVWDSQVRTNSIHVYVYMCMWSLTAGFLL